MGGGTQCLGMTMELVDTESCIRADGRNLAKTWQLNHPEGIVVDNTEDLMAIDISKTSNVLGVFSPSHMPYHAVRTDKTPTLANMTLQAIRMLKKNKNGFLLMVSSNHGNKGQNNNYYCPTTM